ncbi:hypothetical protein CHS0354_018801 [Potamilus streckersoni]|uniref:Uncharacterized protein n=1 Tax=Potamilus streckersoni TaxID=2493646 RepID=A0AAE0TBS0_9BIVA|nr:hypothetical protein CHS0354_018801 [Potamilus streckersoni]
MVKIMDDIKTRIADERDTLKAIEKMRGCDSLDDESSDEDISEDTPLEGGTHPRRPTQDVHAVNISVGLHVGFNMGRLKNLSRRHFYVEKIRARRKAAEKVECATAGIKVFQGNQGIRLTAFTVALSTAIIVAQSTSVTVAIGYLQSQILAPTFGFAAILLAARGSVDR